MITRSTVFALVITLVLLAANVSRAGAGSAQQPRGNPGTFLTHVVSLVVADDYENAWTSLYPAHKRVARRAEYVGCELLNPVGMTLDSISVVDVRDRMLRIPGESARIAGKSVRLRITLADPVSGAVWTFTHAFRVVPAGSRWAWVLTPEQYALYAADAC